ncbi:hypothetical protein ABFV99_04400 [Cytobacillus horneckiae]|uniref:hypothetical protein n=1 Tax=Cytobacillus horneckiae TaxID=549687 RepID=UPI0034D018AF
MLLLAIAVITVIYLFMRYRPVIGVDCSASYDNYPDSISVLDVRDYSQSNKNLSEGSINIPIAYLNRYYHEIKGKEIHVIAPSQLEKNMSIRFLRKKGFSVIGYTLRKGDKTNGL